MYSWGAWVARSVKRLTLQPQSGSRGCEFKPCIGFCARHGAHFKKKKRGHFIYLLSCVSISLMDTLILVLFCALWSIAIIIYCLAHIAPDLSIWNASRWPLCLCRVRPPPSEHLLIFCSHERSQACPVLFLSYSGACHVPKEPSFLYESHSSDAKIWCYRHSSAPHGFWTERIPRSLCAFPVAGTRSPAPAWETGRPRNLFFAPMSRKQRNKYIALWEFCGTPGLQLI